MLVSKLLDGPLVGRVEEVFFNGPDNPTKYMQYEFTLDGESSWAGYSYAGQDENGDYTYRWSYGYGKV